MRPPCETEEKAASGEKARSAPPTEPRPPARSRARQDKSVVEEVVGSTAFRQVLRTAAREIVRGMFKTGRR